MDGWVHLKIDYRNTLKDLTEIQRNQYPFAYSSALTQTAKIAQYAVRQITRDKFNLHSEYIPRGIIITPARKSDVVKKHWAFSAVFTSNAITPFMAWHEIGGVKRPKNKSLAIPSRTLQQRYKYRTKRGSTAARWRPERLLQGYISKYMPRRREKSKDGRSAFIMPKKGNFPSVIARTRKKSDNQLEILYIFTPFARIKAVWGFERTVRDTAERVFERVFEIKWASALATAK